MTGVQDPVQSGSFLFKVKQAPSLQPRIHYTSAHSATKIGRHTSRLN